MKKCIVIFLIVIFAMFADLATSLFAGQKVNINKANVAELMTLPYVGEDTARSIIEYREKHKGFKSIEELKAIKSIGKKKYEHLKGLVTVKDEKSE